MTNLSEDPRTAHGASLSADDGHRPAWARPMVRVAALVAGVAAVAALDVHLISPYVSRAANALRHPAMSWVTIALAAEIFSLLGSTLVQRRMLLATGTRVPMSTAVNLTYSAYAMNMSLPAGAAVSAGYTFRRLRQLGASMPTAGFTLISSSVLSMLAYGLLAVAGFTVAGGSSGGPLAVVVGLLAAGLLVMLTRTLLARPEILERVGVRTLHGINRVRHRDHDAGVADLQRSTSTLASIHPRGRDWATGLGGALVYWFADLGCLYASCRAVGADHATIGVVVLAYLSGTSVSGISLVPGGLGVVDAAVILVLVQDGVATGPAAAAMVLYRVFSFGFTVIAGWIAWIGHARTQRHSAARQRSVPTSVTTPSTTPSIGENHDNNAPPAAPPARRGPAPHPGHVRLPGRARPVADRGGHATVPRCRRDASAVRRRRVRPGAGPRLVPGRTTLPPTAAQLSRRPQPTRHR